MTWLHALNALGLAGCQSMDLIQRGPRQSWGPCPACGALARSESTPHDRRLALQSGGGVAGVGWWCVRCDTRGDVADLMAWHAVGSRIRDLDRDGFRQLRRWAGERIASIDLSEDETIEAPQPDLGPPSYPPGDSLAELWRHSWDLSGPWGYRDRDAEAWLCRRAGAELEQVAATELVRMVPPTRGRPHLDWMPYGDAWRCAWPLYDGAGVMRSLLLRTHVQTVMESKGKERPVMGYDRRGLLIADARAVAMMRGEATPEAVYIVEGPTAALRMSVQIGIAGMDAAVLGIYSGSPAALADVRWPRRCVIAVGTDDDEAGHRYYRQVRTALPADAHVHAASWSQT